MSWTSGTASDYLDLLSKMATFAEANGWTILSQTSTELYMRGEGAGGLDNIYVGVSAFNNVSTGYYNWQLFGSVLYKSSLPVNAQPLTSAVGGWNTYIHLWNQEIPYWMVADGRRIILVAKVSTVYQHAYLGFIDPIGTAAQYPYPLLVGGCSHTSTQLYSGTSQSAYFKGDTPASARIFMPGGTWGRVNYYDGTSSSDYHNVYTPTCVQYPDCTVYNLYYNLRSSFLTAPDDSYLLEPIFIRDRNRSTVLGQISGAYHVTGYNNSSENIITVDGVNYMVFQDTFRTAYSSYCALRMA